MTQEEKQLLLIDLSARLPYKVKGIYARTDIKNLSICEITTHLYGEMEESFNGKEKYEFIPYLRPMSSMTEEEKEELCKLCDFEKSYNDRDYFSHYGIEIISEYCVNGEKIVESIINYNVIDFFYAHHLDWRGLIPMGLALEAPKDMYNYENN